MCCPEDGTSERWLSWFEAATSERKKILGQVLSKSNDNLQRCCIIFVYCVQSVVYIYRWIDTHCLTSDLERA